LAQGVDVVNTNDPFVLRELDLTAEVVHVLDERRKDFSVSRLGLGAHQVDDTLCEKGVEFALSVAICSRLAGVGLKAIAVADAHIAVVCDDGDWICG